MVHLEGQEVTGLKRDWSAMIQIRNQECKVWRRKGSESDEEKLAIALVERTAAKAACTRKWEEYAKDWMWVQVGEQRKKLK